MTKRAFGWSGGALAAGTAAEVGEGAALPMWLGPALSPKAPAASRTGAPGARLPPPPQPPPQPPPPPQQQQEGQQEEEQEEQEEQKGGQKRSFHWGGKIRSKHPNREMM